MQVLLPQASSDSICTPKDPTPNMNFNDDTVPLSPHYEGIHTPMSSVGTDRESLREVALDAVSLCQSDLANTSLPDRDSVRDSIRLIHAHSKRDIPVDCFLTGIAKIGFKTYTLTLERDSIAWVRRGKRRGFIDSDDIIGAELAEEEDHVLRVHFFRKGRGKNEKKLKRKHKVSEFIMDSNAEALAWVHSIKELVRWQARVPGLAATKRRIKVVVNPHSGKRKALQIWTSQVKPLFDLADIEADVEKTTFSGHAVEMGKNYSPDDGYEALVFISGDGTICEYMNGLLARPEKEWKEVVATTPLSLVSAGTQNAFGLGVGIPTVAASVYCIIKRKMRPLDVVTATAAGDDAVHYSCCGLGWGVPGDISTESERYRWMGIWRYEFLKVKRGLLKPKKHTGRIKYVLAQPQPELKKYFDIRNQGATDQHVIEQGNVYDPPTPQNLMQRTWSGHAGAVRDPASEARYDDSQWVIEEGRYVAVGALNAVPDGIYTHPSDGNMDLVIARKGGICRSLQLVGLYLFGKELKSPLMSYIKVKAVVIEQEEPENNVNIDGEVLPGPGPWRMEVVPSLFKVLSEK